MKMKIYSDNPAGLHLDIKMFIEEKKTKTWAITSAEKEPVIYVHDVEQWKEVLLIPTVRQAYLEIRTSRWSSEKNPQYTKDPYVLGRFTELLVTNFLGEFNHIKFEK